MVYHPYSNSLMHFGFCEFYIIEKFIFGHSPTCLMKLLALETPESNAAITTSSGLKWNTYKNWHILKLDIT